MNGAGAVRAAVFDGERLVVTDEIEVAPPGPGEAQVRVVASGICHSDLNAMVKGAAPIVLGHEAAGTVTAYGPEASGPAVGAPVVVGAATPCGACRFCLGGRPTHCAEAFGVRRTPFRWRGQPVRSYANVSSFSEVITVRADQVIAADGLAPQSAALVGCAVSTGYGAVVNVAGVGEGDTVVVWGLGGIGVNAVQAARLRGAGRILAVDVNPAKDAVARRFGADDFVAVPAAAGAAELVVLVGARLGAPVDAVIECCGAPAAIEASVGLLGPGGVAALVGIPPAGTTVAVDVNAALRGGRRIVGSLNGETDPARDLPAIVALARDGRLDLDHQVTGVWPLAEIDAAVAAVSAGEVVRAVLDLTA